MACRKLLIQKLLQGRKLIAGMLRVFQGCIKKACRPYAPAVKSLFHPLAERLKGKLLLHMLINLVDNQIHRLACLSQIPGKGQIQLRLHVVIIHHVEDDIRQVQCRLRSRPVGIIRRINARRVHDNHLGRQIQLTTAQLNLRNGITITAEASQQVIIIRRQIFPGLFPVKENPGIILPALAPVHPYQVGTGGNGAGRQEAFPQQAVNHPGLAGRKMTGKGNAVFPCGQLFRQVPYPVHIVLMAPLRKEIVRSCQPAA